MFPPLFRFRVPHGPHAPLEIHPDQRPWPLMWTAKRKMSQMNLTRVSHSSFTKYSLDIWMYIYIYTHLTNVNDYIYIYIDTYSLSYFPSVHAFDWKWIGARSHIQFPSLPGERVLLQLPRWCSSQLFWVPQIEVTTIFDFQFCEINAQCINVLQHLILKWVLKWCLIYTHIYIYVYHEITYQ